MMSQSMNHIMRSTTRNIMRPITRSTMNPIMNMRNITNHIIASITMNFMIQFMILPKKLRLITTMLMDLLPIIFQISKKKRLKSTLMVAMKIIAIPKHPTKSTHQLQSQNMKSIIQILEAARVPPRHKFLILVATLELLARRAPRDRIQTFSTK